MKYLNQFIPITILVSYFIKTMFISPTLFDTFVLATLAGLYFSIQYFTQSKSNKDIIAKLSEFEKKIEDQRKFLEENRLAIAGMKIVQAKKPGISFTPQSHN